MELGDLREGVLPGDLVPLARYVVDLPGLDLAGVGTNLACQHGVVPDQAKMDELSGLATDVEAATGVTLSVVSGGLACVVSVGIVAVLYPELARYDGHRAQAAA